MILMVRVFDIGEIMAPNRAPFDSVKKAMNQI